MFVSAATYSMTGSGGKQAGDAVKHRIEEKMGRYVLGEGRSPRQLARIRGPAMVGGGYHDENLDIHHGKSLFGGDDMVAGSHAGFSSSR